LREKLKPVAKVPAAQIDKLIADLDDKNFKTRDMAFLELRRIGLQGKTALTKALERHDSLELRRRIQNLLAELASVPSDQELREIRAVQILEAIGTPPARSILQSLAKGASGVRLTDQAAAALGRWELRPRPKE